MKLLQPLSESAGLLIGCRCLRCGLSTDAIDKCGSKGAAVLAFDRADLFLRETFFTEFVD